MLRNSVLPRSMILISASLILAAIIIVLVPKRALAGEGEGVPIKGSFIVSPTVVTTPAACGVGDSCVVCVTSPTPHNYVEAQGIGDISKLGTLLFKIQKCADPSAPPFGNSEGTLTMTAPNGTDSLTGIETLENTSARDAYKFLPFSGKLTITGGTGKFEGAQGSANLTGVATSNNMTAFYAVEGTVSLEDGHR